jgi:NDP-sugar pyrophosphorylase family protein
MAFDQPTRAFVLGAGLGTRLRPLTEHTPKPLLPVKGRPLVFHILRRLAAVGIREVMINTHHAHEKWKEAFPTGEAEGLRVSFRHEPVRLETGGGLKNVEDFFRAHGTFLIHSGDILTTLPIEKAIAHHQRERNLVTLVLRSGGGPLHVSLDRQNRIVDIRAKLGAEHAQHCLFANIHLVEPEIFDYIPRVEFQSIIPIYLDLIQRGLRVGGVVIDEGEWTDIGTLAEYERLN